MLILAIEADKRQSTQLANLVKGLQTDLVLRGNAADGLAALQGRVPDLVLTSSLISTRDDAALAAHLRELGAAAAHVQTVTIPLLGSAPPARAKGGVLAALRRERPQAPMTDGCAPDVFAEQVRQYLATAEEQKVTAATRLAVEPEAPVAEEDAAPAEEVPSPFVEFTAPEPEPAEAPAVEAAAFEAPVFEAIAATPEEEAPIAEPEPVAEPIEAAVAEPAALVVAPEEFAAEADDLVADEPAGLPLSQLLQLVSETARPRVVEPRVVEDFEEAVVEPEMVDEPEPAAGLEAANEPEAVGDFGELFTDPIAAQALDELSRQAPQATLAEGIPGEAPVPVVEMHSFQSLDSIANELAAGSSSRHESLDDLASLFAAAPAATSAAAPVQAENKNLFASLYAEPGPAHPGPIEVPGIDPGLFASAPAAPPAAFEPEPEPESTFVQPPQEIAPAFVAPLPEPVVAEFHAAAPEQEPIVAAAPEPEPVVEDTPIAFEPVAFDEEIALDVDSFEAALAAPQAPAEAARFSFTFVDGFGDALSDFEVPSIATMASGLGVGEHAPLDPYAAAPARAGAAAPAPGQNAGEPLAAPMLDQEALSLIGDAARKVSLDSMVIEEFEKGYPGRRPVKKAKKKVHAGATPVAPAAERPAKPTKRPVQDEWGMFDPEQAGFAALEDEEEGAESRPTTGTRVRVISY